MSRNRDTMTTFLNVSHCTSKKNLPCLGAEAQQTLENIKRGSSSQVKSKDEDCEETLIERDRIIVCSAAQFAMDNENKKEIKTK